MNTNLVLDIVSNPNFVILVFLIGMVVAIFAGRRMGIFSGAISMVTIILAVFSVTANATVLIN